MCSDAEYEAVERYVAEHDVTPERQGLTCPWYQDGKCQVHPVRPGICRLFGHVENMVCCKGYNVNIGSRLKREWDRKLLNSMPTRLLHTVFEDWKQMLKEGVEAL